MNKYQADEAIPIGAVIGSLGSVVGGQIDK